MFSWENLFPLFGSHTVFLLGLHTVHVNMITSLDDTHWDMQCVHVHRDISVLAPSTQLVWLEYICIMELHTLQSLWWMMFLDVGVMRFDEEYVGMQYHKKSWHKINFITKSSVENVMSRESKGLQLNYSCLSPHLGNTAIILKKSWKNKNAKAKRKWQKLFVYYWCFNCRICLDRSSALNSAIWVV